MKNINSIAGFVDHVLNDSELPVRLEIIGPHTFSLVGTASSKESIYGAVAKLVSARQGGQIPSFTGEQSIVDALNSWKGGGGGFSGGGASGSW